MKFYVSLTATEATLGDGAPLVRGEEIDLTPSQRKEPHNARLIAEGQLISISQPNAAQQDAEETVENRNSNVTPITTTTEGGADQ